MPGPNGHGGGGWCAVFVGDGRHHRDSGTPRRVVCSRVQPPSSPLDALFIERYGAAPHEKLLGRPLGREAVKTFGALT